MLRRDEEIVLHKKAGEEDPMPLVIGELLGEMFDLVETPPRLAFAISQLLGLGSEFAPQIALCFISCAGRDQAHALRVPQAPCARRPWRSCGPA